MVACQNVRKKRGRGVKGGMGAQVFADQVGGAALP